MFSNNVFHSEKITIPGGNDKQYPEAGLQDFEQQRHGGASEGGSEAQQAETPQKQWKAKSDSPGLDQPAALEDLEDVYILPSDERYPRYKKLKEARRLTVWRSDIDRTRTIANLSTPRERSTERPKIPPLRRRSSLAIEDTDEAEEDVEIPVETPEDSIPTAVQSRGEPVSPLFKGNSNDEQLEVSESMFTSPTTQDLFGSIDWGDTHEHSGEELEAGKAGAVISNGMQDYDINADEEAEPKSLEPWVESYTEDRSGVLEDAEELSQNESTRSTPDDEHDSSHDGTTDYPSETNKANEDTTTFDSAPTDTSPSSPTSSLDDDEQNQSSSLALNVEELYFYINDDPAYLIEFVKTFNHNVSARIHQLKTLICYLKEKRFPKKADDFEVWRRHVFVVLQNERWNVIKRLTEQGRTRQEMEKSLTIQRRLLMEGRDKIEEKEREIEGKEREIEEKEGEIEEQKEALQNAEKLERVLVYQRDMLAQGRKTIQEKEQEIEEQKEALQNAEELATKNETLKWMVDKYRGCFAAVQPGGGLPERPFPSMQDSLTKNPLRARFPTTNPTSGELAGLPPLPPVLDPSTAHAMYEEIKQDPVAAHDVYMQKVQASIDRIRMLTIPYELERIAKADEAMEMMKKWKAGKKKFDEHMAMLHEKLRILQAGREERERENKEELAKWYEERNDQGGRLDKDDGGEDHTSEIGSDGAESGGLVTGNGGDNGIEDADKEKLPSHQVIKPIFEAKATEPIKRRMSV